MASDRIYVSHSDSDSDWAQCTASDLAQAGLSITMNANGGGSVAMDAIEEQISSCQFVLLLVSSSSCFELLDSGSKRYHEVGEAQ